LWHGTCTLCFKTHFTRCALRSAVGHPLHGISEFAEFGIAATAANVKNWIHWIYNA
jgi:hypothetical protein